MKKGLALLSVILIVAVLFSACSGSQTSDGINGWYQKKDANSFTGTTSDYSLSENWLSLPSDSKYDVDVIYLYPTCYTANGKMDSAVCDITDESMRENAKETLKSEASVFETVANIYAPYYRQYSVSNLSATNRDDLYSYLAKEPRTDVFGALDYYFENYNNNKPYILAGHTQGSVLLNMVLAEYMDAHPEYYSRMVAAYQIGYSVSKQWLEKNEHIRFAQSAEDTGVVVSWCTEAPSNFGKANIFVLDDAVSINPLSWTTEDTHALKATNKGSYLKNSNGEYEVVYNVADAKINLTRGSVIAVAPDPNIYAAEDTELYGEGSYMDYDYSFYYMNLRENAQTRIENYKKTH